MKTGIVIESTGSHYVVLTPEGRTLETKLRGKLRLNGSRTTNPVAVGDRVRYEETAGTGATITEVEPAATTSSAAPPTSRRRHTSSPRTSTGP